MSEIEIDELVYSRRKSIALIVDEQGRLVVRAPKGMSKALIQSFIQEKAGWIRQKQANAEREIARCDGKTLPYHFQEGERFWYLGQVYSLKLVEKAAKSLVFASGFQLRRAERSRGRQLFESWYKTQARTYFERRTPELAKQFAFHYQSIRLSSAQKRWGSCSSRGSINLNWRLIMAPAAVIDSVIVHELVHLEIKNHSRQFWQRLEQLMPEYQTLRKWLDENARCLAWFA